MSEKKTPNEGNSNKLDENLASEINQALNNQNLNEDLNEDLEGDLEEDPELLMKTNPMASIAISLYHIERTLKAMLYIQNIHADEGLTYSRDHFYGIFGGEDPELITQREIERLRKLDEDTRNNDQKN